ncbi:hypothetical protein [Clostridium tagluense]|uniref:hypothetical protein n=1 Tax=Clostridium tagluense TaxID=360422 RepID=UPI001C6F30F0|nr:hypothetical protein [Clostridium tagluense]MBW9158939.1 hypothetical protein [Clostridium tagluense]WLC68325.1 hypothetical protein KTC93_24575 [Clostridium tagluense]
MSNTDRERKENFELGKSLTKENDIIFTDIVCYLRVSDINEEQQEEIISDILRMFLDWQEEGKSLENMVGEDYKKFTDDIISAVNPKKDIFKKTKDYLVMLVEFSCFMLTIDFIISYLPKLLKGNHDFNLTYNYTLAILINTLLIIIVATTLVTYICKNSFAFSKKCSSKFENFIFGCSAAGLIILSVVLSMTLRHIIILSINIRFVIGIIAVYWVYKGVKKIYSA